MKNTARKVNDLTSDAATQPATGPATKSREDQVREEKQIRENLSEQEIDKTLQDSFPASDPPAWY